MIYNIGITISIFLGVILLTKKNKTVADKLLATWLFVTAFHLFVFTLFINKGYLKFPYFLGLEKPLPLLHGAFIYLYTSSLTSPSKINLKSFFHLVPFLFALGLIAPFLLRSNQEKVIIYQAQGAGYEIVVAIIFFGIIVSGITYSALSFRSLLLHRKKIKNNFSDIEKITLQWLFNLIIGISFIWVIVIFGNDQLIFTAVVIYVIYIGYFGIKQVGIFHNNHPLSSALEKETIKYPLAFKAAEPEKYETSKLSNEQLALNQEKLNRLMEKEKLYLIPELTLSNLAEQLNIHPNTLSEVINRTKQKNFFDYINTLRVEEFKERVAKPENQKFTLLSLALNCGFNSKTSFNRNFKNSVGKSPSEYIKENNISLK